MINSLQVQAYRATKDSKYLDRAALQTAAYLDRLQQENRLFSHGPEAWKESSSTAMFGLAMAVGVESGILPATPFADAYHHAWGALVRRIDQDGRLTDVCVGTGLSKEVNYYLERPKTSGDFHGQAPMLWFAAELLAQTGAMKETAN